MRRLLAPSPWYACLSRPTPGASLAAIAEQFSPRYEQLRDDLVTIEVSGLERLLGGPRAIGEELVREATARGLRAQVAVAGTRTAAIVLAQARPGLTVVGAGGEAAALASVPIGLLEKVVEGAPCSMLKTWGIRTFGELAALPAAELAARLGVQAPAWQALARGEDGRPLVPTLPEERFESTLALEWPIEGLEPLSFVLTRLLEPLSTRLERRDRGAAVLHVILRLVDGATHARRLELPSPIRDLRTLRALALLDLESHPPPAAVDGVAVAIDPTPGRVLQHALFTHAHPTPDALATLLARLGALMGQDRLGAPATVETYRPGAYAVKPFATEHWTSPRAAGERMRGHVVSVLRRCRYPVPARVMLEHGRPVRVTTDRRAVAGGRVMACAGPWRSSGAWWHGGAGGSSERDGASEASGAQRAVQNDARVSGVGEGPPRRSVLDKREDHGPSASGVGEGPPRRSVLDMREDPGPSASGVGVGPHASKSWSRDEWEVALSDGAVYCLGYDRERDRWFIDGIVD
jgi:protein ImuB